MSKVDVRDEMDSDKSEVEGGEGRGQKIAFLCVYSSQLSLFPNAAASTDEASAFLWRGEYKERASSSRQSNFWETHKC